MLCQILTTQPAPRIARTRKDAKRAGRYIVGMLWTEDVLDT